MQSVSNLITQLLWRPSQSKDTVALNLAFAKDFHVHHVIRLREAVRSHVRLVQQICTPSREVMIELGAQSTSIARRRELQAIVRDYTLAIQHVDKPNLHRLSELAGTTLHMLPTVALIGEFPLEKRHQVMKRAVNRANNIDIHLHAMSTSVFNDWQSRLSANFADAHNGDINARRACFRLLQGREAI